MKHARPRRRSKLWWLPWAVFMAAVVALLPLIPKQRATAPAVNTSADRPTTFSLTTADGVKLETELRTPIRNATVPAVILVHRFGADRHEWDPYLKAFLDAGVAVLMYDARGFGNSSLGAIQPDLKTLTDGMPNDVAAAVQYIRTQPAIAADRISVVGSGLGANLAFAASGTPHVYRAVALSPDFSAGLLAGEPADSPRGVLAIGRAAQHASLENIDRLTGDPKKVNIVAGDTDGAGLLADADIVKDVIAWIAPSS